MKESDVHSNSTHGFTIKTINKITVISSKCSISQPLCSKKSFQVDSASSSISCSINWPKNKALDKKNIKIPVVLGSLGNLFVVNVQFDLFKKKNKPASKTQTNNPSFEKQVELNKN